MSFHTNRLDHIVHLSPPGSVEQISQQFRELGFNVLPGGTHAGGQTANALVVFSDTAYIELISFTSPPPPTSDHRWASKSPGWIDYAFLGNGSTSPHTRISDIINSRYSGGGQLYTPEQPGGRTKPNGQILKWLITAPPDKSTGVLPFFCGDITPREWRVPSEINDTKHPSSAQGVAFVKILVPTHTDLIRVSDQLKSVIGAPPFISTDEKVIWKLYNDRTLLEVRLPADEDEESFVKTGVVGIYEIGIYVRKGTKSGSVKTPYAKLTWVETSD